MPKISDQFDEQELLALIERELDGSAEQKLLEKLDSHPQTRKLVRELLADRQALRSLPEPELPRDFMVDIEPLLARPMLMEPIQTKPGEYRRRHQQRNQKPFPWKHLVAAVVGLSTIAAIWSVTYTFNSADNLVADDSANPANKVNQGDRQLPGLFAKNPGEDDPADEFSPEEGVLHHFGPQNMEPTSLIASANPAITPSGSRAVASSNERIVLGLVVTFETDDDRQIAQAMRDLSPEFDRTFAFLRNRPVRVPRNGVQRPNNGDVLAGTSPFQAGSGSADDWGDISEDIKMHLPDVMKSRLDELNRQTLYTIRVRSSELGALFNQIWTIKDCPASMQTIHDMLEQNPPKPLKNAAARLAQWSKIRSEFSELWTRSDDPIVILPVIVRETD